MTVTEVFSYKSTIFIEVLQEQPRQLLYFLSKRITRWGVNSMVLAMAFGHSKSVSNDGY